VMRTLWRFILDSVFGFSIPVPIICSRKFLKRFSHPFRGSLDIFPVVSGGLRCAATTGYCLAAFQVAHIRRYRATASAIHA
jgi:hypothetical protein